MWVYCASRENRLIRAWLSPVRPTLRSTRPYRLVFPKSAPRRFVREVKPVVIEAIASAQRILPLESSVRLRVTPDTREAVSTYMQGSTGWTRDSQHVYVGVNTQTKGWRRSLKRTVAHELNHTVRDKRTAKRKGKMTMLDTIAFEGLAQCFEKEVSGELPPYAAALSVQQTRRIWSMIKHDLDSRDEALYRRIFFARDDRDVPTWAGYRLSYMIVSRRMKRLELGWDARMGLSSEEIVGRRLG